MGFSATDEKFMRAALRLAARGRGRVSPNPMVGAVIVRDGRILGRGYHKKAGALHAEMVALRNLESRGSTARGATLYVTLEPCSTHGRTPPCTDAIIASGIRRVVAAAIDPNPSHAGRGYGILGRAGVEVASGLLDPEATRMNEVFNHWIVHRRPFVTLKAAMTLDGRIATAEGRSRWITGERARLESMRLRGRHDAILVGVETVLADDPSLTWRPESGASTVRSRPLRRIILDSLARTPRTAKVANNDDAASTTIFVTAAAPARRVEALRRKVRVEVVAAARDGRVDLSAVLHLLGKEETTSLLVEGGGAVHASFVESGNAGRVVFFYAPLVLGGDTARRAVAGRGAPSLALAPKIENIQWKRVGTDLMLSGTVSIPLGASIPAAG